MKVGILGAGAMGSYFGAKLAARGHSVLLVDLNPDHIRVLATAGLTLVEPGGEWVVRPEAVTRVQHPEPVDYLIVLTKANAVVRALGQNTGLVGSQTTVVVLANGLGNGERASGVVPAGALLYGATAAGAILDAPGRVRFTVPGQTYVGAYGGGVTPRLRAFVELLNQAALPAVASERVDDYIWTKLMINVGYNALTAITRLRNGDLVRHPVGRQLLEAAVGEAVAVARATGIHLHMDNPVADVVEIGLTTIGPNPSSMLHDVLRGQETEVAALNGAVAALGERAGVPTPVNRVLYDLVLLIQENYGRKVPPEAIVGGVQAGSNEEGPV